MREPGSRHGPAGAVAALALLAAAAAPVPGAAQEPLGDAAGEEAARAPARSGLELDASAALVTPLSDLVEGTAAEGALQLSTGVGVRAGALWWIGDRLGVGLGGLWTPADVDRQPSAGDGNGGVDPGGKVAEGDYVAGTAEVVWALPRPGPDVRVEPYLAAGLGLRHLAFEGGEELPGGTTDPMASIGGGFRVLLSEGLLLRLEARDQIAPAEIGPETRIQHDLDVSLGFGVRP